MTTLPLDTIKPLVAFCDPAWGKPSSDVMKRVASRSAIVVVGMERALGRVFVVFAWAKRCGTDVLIEKLYEVAARFRPLRTFGIESNGGQALFGDALTRDAKWQGRYLPLQKVQQPTTKDKDSRIRSRLQAVVAHGRLFLLDNDPGVAELRAELTTFPQNPMKDLVDACATAVSLLPPMMPRRVRDVATEELVAHLRRTGAPPEAIRDAANRSRAWT